MVNQFTPYIFVYSRSVSDINWYHNDIIRANINNPHILLLYRGSIADFVYTDPHGERTMPTTDITKLIEYADGVEGNVLINTGDVIKAKIAYLAEAVANKTSPDIQLAVYYIK